MDNTAVIRSARGPLSLAACALLSAVVFAHELPVEQKVEISMRRQGDRLVVQMHVPSTLFGAAPFQVAADEVARNLDVRQNDASLAPPALSAIRGADRAWTDVELTYRIDANANGISARLNGFQAPPMQPVRTTVTFVPTNGRAQVVSVVGPATRVQFDPSTLDTVQDFAARALRSVLTFGDHLMLLACLLLPLRSGRDAGRLFGALAAGQAVGLTAFTFGAGITPVFALATSMIAASAVVVAAVQSMVNARHALVKALAVAFGVLNGVAFADAFAAGRQFAGAHQLMAFVVVLSVVIVGQFWLGAVMWATRAWLDRRGAPNWMFAIVVSALVAHTAMHAVLDRGQALAADGTFAVDRAVFWLTMMWVIVMLVIAAGEWLRQSRVRAYSTSQ
jgi:hypothetical protein